MISDSELARGLFVSTGKMVGELVKSGIVTTTIEATAVADSEDGYVLVDMGGDTVTGDGPADQNADTDEDIASSETPVASDENMSPCINMESDDAEYWSQVSEGLTITPVEDGWARVAYDNTEGESAVTLDAWQNPLDAVEEGETYTLLVEIRPVLPESEGSEEEDTPESHDPDDVPEDEEDGYGADDAEPEEGSDTDGDSTAEVTSSITPTTATSQLGASASQRMDAGETWLTLTGQTGDTLLGTQFTVDAGKAMEADVRMSLYFGDYTGEYIPYGLLEGGAWQLVPTSSAVKAGDTVTISLVGGSMVDSRAIGSGDRISATAEQAKTLAQQAEQIASAIGQFAWNDNAGTHVSTEEAVAEGTRNILLNSYGILLRAAANYLAALTQSGIAFYDGTGNLADNIVASFGSSGAQIGNIDETLGHSADQYKMLLDSSGLHIVFQGTQDVVVYDTPTEVTSLGVGVLDLLGLHLESYNGGSSSNYSTIKSNNKELYISSGSGYSDRGIYIGDFDPTAAKHPVTTYGNTGVNGNLYLPNNKSIYGTDTNGNAVYALETCNANNNLTLGYGGYAASQGATNIYGNNIALQAKNRISFNAQTAYPNGTALPSAGNSTDFYAIGINAFSNGGIVKYKGLADVKAWLGMGNVDYTNTNWVTGASGCYYRKRAGYVCLVFANRTWDGTSETTIYTLPSGYRPNYKLNVASANSGANGQQTIIVIQTDGAVRFVRNASNASKYFNACITFPIG